MSDKDEAIAVFQTLLKNVYFMTIDQIKNKLNSILRQQQSKGKILEEDQIARCSQEFNHAMTSLSADQRDEAIGSLKDKVTLSSPLKGSNTVFEVMLRNCPDAEIAHYLGLHTWDGGINTVSAKNRIIECFKKMTSILDLTDLKLTSLPAGICKLTHLQTLNCSGNKLEELPVGIGQLQQLKHLDCTRNAFKEMPLVLDLFESISKVTLIDEISPLISNKISKLQLDKWGYPVSGDTAKKIFHALGDNWWKQIYDGKFLKYGKMVFDEGKHSAGTKEPGFYESASEAFAYAKENMGKSITIEFYQNLHGIACQRFKGKENNTLMLASQAYAFRTEETLGKAPEGNGKRNGGAICNC